MHARTRMHARTQTRTHASIHTHTHTHTHTRTHTHTHRAMRGPSASKERQQMSSSFFSFFPLSFADVTGIVHNLTSALSIIIRHPGDKNVQLRCYQNPSDYNFYFDSRWVAGKGKRLQITYNGKVVSSLAKNYSVSTKGSSQTLVIKKGNRFLIMLSCQMFILTQSQTQYKHSTARIKTYLEIEI